MTENVTLSPYSYIFAGDCFRKVYNMFEYFKIPLSVIAIPGFF
jgi:hypothetical protein